MQLGLLSPVTKTSGAFPSRVSLGWNGARSRLLEVIPELSPLRVGNNCAKYSSQRSPDFAVSSGSHCRRFSSCRSARVQQNSTRLTNSAQTIQHQSLTTNKIPLISTGSRIWFGTRGSEVQILSPRPNVSSYLENLPGAQNQSTWSCTRCSIFGTRVLTLASLAE
jgi:hypothetical protein